MAAIDWLTTQTALDAAIATANGPDLTLLSDVRARLNRAGTGYDALWSAMSPDADKTASQAAEAAALAAWSGTYTAAHNDGDKAARQAESLQVAEQAAFPQPYVATLDGTRIVLAPASAITVATDETPIDTAARNLTASAANALRVTAKAPGTAGNRVEVKVENATSGSTKCKLSVRLGSYVEVYDEIEGGGAIPLSGSLLLASAEWFGTTRPDNAAWAYLTGGAGGSFAAVLARIDTAMRLPAAADQVSTIQAYRAALVTAYGSRPRDGVSSSGADAYWRQNRPLGVHYFGRAISVREVEQLLAALLEEATALLAAATY